MAGARRQDGLCEVREIPEGGWAVNSPAGWGSPPGGNPCPLLTATLHSPVLLAGPLVWAQRFRWQPLTTACASALRGLEGGTLSVTHQLLPWHGAGVSRGELQGPVRGAALPQSSGAPRSKTWGQWRDGTGLREQSQGLAGLGQRQ